MNIKFICPDCKGENVQVPTWCNPNTNECFDTIDIGDWCDDCKKAIKVECITEE